jgi:hypothetical protein
MLRVHARRVGSARGSRPCRRRADLRAAVALVALLAAVVGGTRPARSLSLAAQSLADLDAGADVVVRGRCIDRVPTRSGGRIESVARFAVVETLRGDAGAVVEVRQWGGRDGERVTVAPGAPLSEPGDEAVLFLSAEADGSYRVVGVASGDLPLAVSPLGGPLVRVSRALGPEFAGAAAWPLERFAERLRRLPRSQ